MHNILISLFIICLNYSEADDIKKIDTNNKKEIQKIVMNYPDAYESLLENYKSRVVETFKKAHVELTIQSVPSERGMMLLKSGASDAELARTIDVAETEHIKNKYFRVQTPLDVFELNYFYLDDKFKNFKKLDLKKTRIGVIHGAKISLKYAEKFSTVNALKDNAGLVSMLKSNRIDLFLLVNNKSSRQNLVEQGLKSGVVTNVPIYTLIRSDFRSIEQKINKIYKSDFGAKN